MRNTGGQQGEKWAAVKTKGTGAKTTKFLVIFEKMMCNKEVSRFSRAKQPQRNVQKSVLHVQFFFFFFG